MSKRNLAIGSLAAVLMLGGGFYFVRSERLPWPGIAATSSTPSASEPGQEPRNLELATIKKGSLSGHTDRRNYVIGDEKDWAELWDKMYPDKASRPALPDIDFSKYIVLAAFEGEKSTAGYDFEIQKAVETSSKVDVLIKETVPSSECYVSQNLVQPFHIVKIASSQKVIVFDLRTEIKKCD